MLQCEQTKKGWHKNEAALKVMMPPQGRARIYTTEDSQDDEKEV